MADLPDREPPRVWIAAGIFLAALALAFLMLVYTSINAHAQPRCGPLEAVIEGLAIAKERVVWEGTMPTAQGAVEAMLFQSERGTWTIVVVQGVTDCLIAMGKDGTPIETGEGV